MKKTSKPKSASRTSASRGPAWGKLALIALVIAGLAAIWHYTPLADFLTRDRIIGWVQSVGDVPWAPVAVLLVYTPASFLMFPRPLITLFAVLAFGPWVGFFTAMSGIVLAALVTYYVGRALPRETVRHLAGEKIDAMSEILRRRGLLAVFAVRIVPVGPFAVIGIVAGAVGIKAWHLAAGTVLGMAPGTLTTTVFGDQLQAVFEDPSKINYWLLAGVLLLFLVVGFFVRRWFVKQHASVPRKVPA